MIDDFYVIGGRHAIRNAVVWIVLYAGLFLYAVGEIP